MSYPDITVEDPSLPDDYDLVKAPGEALLSSGAEAPCRIVDCRDRGYGGGRGGGVPHARTQAPAASCGGACTGRATAGASRPAPPILVPPLDESDAFVRELVKAISSHPLTAAWLATDGLIRNFTVVTVTIAEGKTPAGDLRVLRPSSSFSVVGRGADLVIDPRSYQRYDAVAAARGGDRSVRRRAPVRDPEAADRRGARRAGIFAASRSIARSRRPSSCCSRRRS